MNTTVLETITHHYIIHIFIKHKVHLTNIKMAKAVVALSAQVLQQVNFHKEKYYYRIYMRINRSALSEYQKMKKLNKYENRETSMSGRIYVEDLQTTVNKF